MASSQLLTIFAGFTGKLAFLKPKKINISLVISPGSLLFVFLLSAVGNLEKAMFGMNFQTKLGEVVFSIVMAMAAAGTVHRVRSLEL